MEENRENRKRCISEAGGGVICATKNSCTFSDSRKSGDSRKEEFEIIKSGNIEQILTLLDANVKSSRTAEVLSEKIKTFMVSIKKETNDYINLRDRISEQLITDKITQDDYDEIIEKTKAKYLSKFNEILDNIENNPDTLLVLMSILEKTSEELKQLETTSRDGVVSFPVKKSYFVLYGEVLGLYGKALNDALYHKLSQYINPGLAAYLAGIISALVIARFPHYAVILGAAGAAVVAAKSSLDHSGEILKILKIFDTDDDESNSKLDQELRRQISVITTEIEFEYKQPPQTVFVSASTAVSTAVSTVSEAVVVALTSLVSNIAGNVINRLYPEIGDELNSSTVSSESMSSMSSMHSFITFKSKKIINDRINMSIAALDNRCLQPLDLSDVVSELFYDIPDLTVYSDSSPAKLSLKNSDNNSEGVDGVISPLTQDSHEGSEKGGSKKRHRKRVRKATKKIKNKRTKKRNLRKKRRSSKK